MSIRRILAVGMIFVLACAGWSTLGTATAIRSRNQLSSLGRQVTSLWGAPLAQPAPSLAVPVPGSDKVRWLMPHSNKIQVDLDTDYRRKGLIWYPTYTCAFNGTYAIANPDDVAQKVRLHFDFPAKGATYDNFRVTVDGAPLDVLVDTHHGIDEIIELKPGETREFAVTYRTRGIRDWRYKMDPHVGRVRNLDLTVKTEFENVDYTEGSLSPMSAEASDGGMLLRWEASDLITSEDIGVIIPEKLNPGPLTTRITFFAPVCLLFFFVLIGTINILYKVDIHPMHYLFVAAGFFAFHLLLSYLVGVLNVHLAFIISALVSVFLVTSYLAAALRGKLPRLVAITGQLFYLVLFSYSFFLDGTTGLTVAIGSVLTLAVLMRVTASVDWTEVFARPARKKATRTLPPALPQEAASVPEG